MSFVYHANALAFGAVINKPCCDVIPSLGSVVLAPSGGEGSATVRNYNYKGIISFDEASVYVGGSQKGVYRNTVSTVMIRNLNLFNVIHVGMLCTRVTSEHVAVDEKDQSDCISEASFTFEGSTLENVRIAGRRVNVKFDTSLFCRYSTYGGFVDAFGGGSAAKNDVATLESSKNAEAIAQASERIETRKRNVSLYAPRFSWPADRCAEGAPSRSSAIRCSLVEDIDIPNTNEDFSDDKGRRANDKTDPVRRNGYVVRVADFGTLAIGEVIIKENQRTVNMLRFTLGSPNDGSGTAGTGTTNGTPMYP